VRRVGRGEGDTQVKATHVRALGAMGFSVLVTALLLRPPLGFIPWRNEFRGFMSFDQLAYATIGEVAANGNWGFVEPFTETGSSFYPSMWYRFLGLVANTFDLPIFVVWSVMGMGVILMAVLVVGLLTYLVSGRWWLPALVGPMLWIGPLSMVAFNSWFISADSHATLWAPYAMLYPLNAEAVGMSLAAIAFAFMVWAVAQSSGSLGRRVVVLTAGAGVIGLLANVQTYAFLLATGVLAWWLALWGLLKCRSRVVRGMTISLLLVTLVSGWLFKDALSALPTYGLMLLATLPGAWVVARDHLRVAWMPIAAFAILASPQILWTAWGTLNGDEFLTYRTETSGALGVPVWAWVLGTAPVGLIWLALLLASRRGTPIAVRALLFALGVAHVILTYNNLWGFVQEPYRFWINSVALTALLLPLLAAWTLRAVDGASCWIPAARTTVAIGAALTLVSFWNIGAFRDYVQYAGVLSLETPRYQAVTEVGAQADGLLMPQTCLNPSLVKIGTGTPVAHFNKGIAWPDNREAIEEVMAITAANVFEIGVAQRAGVQYVMTDSGCEDPWDLAGVPGAEPIALRDYVDEEAKLTGQVRLWRIS
jgi:hypothetical protein